MIRWRGIPMAQMCYSADGDVIFNWAHGGRRLEASIDREGHLVWVVDEGDRVVPGQDIQLLDDGFAPLISALREFYSLP